MKNRLLVFALLALLAPSPRAAWAATVVPPRNLGELAALSDAIVLARAGTQQVIGRGPLLLTETSFTRIDCVAGRVCPDNEFTVEIPGGRRLEDEWLVDGSPTFIEGQSYLLFLHRSETGVWQPRMLSYGLLERVVGDDGTNVLVPLREWRDLEIVPRLDGAFVEPVGTYREGALIEHLREVEAGLRTWDESSVSVETTTPASRATALSAPSVCTFMRDSPPYPRWTEFGLGRDVPMHAESTGDTSLPLGATTDRVTRAIDTWDRLTGTNINVTYAGAMSFALNCTTDPKDKPPSGTNLIIFNDPCNDIPDLSGCSGTLGFGGPYWYTGSTHTFDGVPWYAIASWFAIINNGAGCIDPYNDAYRRMLAHELGHGLGFGHVNDPAALMNETISESNDINATDLACAQYLYPSLPGAFSLTSPGNGATVSGTSVTLGWQPSSGATSYDVYFGTASSPPLLGNQTATTRSVSVSSGSTYYWRVVARNSSSQTSAPASGAWSFTVSGGPPGAFSLSSPVNGATVSGSSVTLQWASSSGATTYDVYFGTASSPPLVGNQTGTTRSVSVSSGSTYYWRVVAKNSSGQTSAPASGAWSFTVSGGPPGAFSLSSPANGATVSGSSVTLQWGTSSGATSYDVYIGTASRQGLLGNQTATTCLVGAAPGTYYWRVVAKNNSGQTSAPASGAWSFTVSEGPPGAFSLSSPANGVSVTDTTVTLQWASSSGATSYDVYFGTASSPPLLGNQTATTRNVSVSSGPTYYWRVVAKNSSGQTSAPPSGAWSFTVSSANLPGSFTLTSPADGVTVPGSRVTLRWGASSGATSYDVYFGIDATPPLLGNQVGTSRDVTVATRAAYFWQVVAKNANGQTPSGTGFFAVAAVTCGESWASVGSLPTQTELYGVAWNGERLVAVGTGGTILTSSDGSSWTLRTSGTNYRLNSVRWKGTIFIAVGNHGTILTSPDGLTWTPRNSGTTQNLYDLDNLTYSGPGFWDGTLAGAVGAGGIILTTANGTEWTRRGTGDNSFLLGATRTAGATWVVVGEGQILTGNVGTWAFTRRHSCTSSLRAAAVHGRSADGPIVAVGQGTILTSHDEGVTWSAVSSPDVEDNPLSDITWAAYQFVAISDWGTLTSPDGIAWTSHYLPASIPNLGLSPAITWTGSQLVAVGNTGDEKALILRSPCACEGPLITLHPENKEIVAGRTATLSVTARGIPTSLSYHWYQGVSGETLLPVGFNENTLTTPSLTATSQYWVRVADECGQADSSTATVTVGSGSTNRDVHVVACSGSSGGTVAVPIELAAQGDENALGFSLTFDSTVLSNPAAALGRGANGATLNTNSSQVATGKVGIQLALPAGQVFAAGTRQLVVVTFAVAAGTSAPSTPIGFADQPIGREISGASATVLEATWSGGTVTLTQGYEADVTPRSAGNGAVTTTDWVQVGRFAASLDTAAAGSEFQRADCAPRDTLGDGRISTTDWVQAGRYAAGLDPLTSAGGPTASASSLLSAPGVEMLRDGRLFIGAKARRLALKTIEQGGQDIDVIITLDASGAENALAFSLQIDPATLSFASAQVGRDASGALVNTNTSLAIEGQIGVALALPPGASLFAPDSEVLILHFNRTGFESARPATITFAAHGLVEPELVSVDATSLPLSLHDGHSLRRSPRHQLGSPRHPGEVRP
jgi:hypothetical protein